MVGCLNRHVKTGEDYYSAPTESEAYAALNASFGIDDRHYVKKTLQKDAFELG